MNDLILNSVVFTILSNSHKNYCNYRNSDKLKALTTFNFRLTLLNF